MNESKQRQQQESTQEYDIMSDKLQSTLDDARNDERALIIIIANNDNDDN